MFKYPSDLIDLVKTSWKENKAVAEYYEYLPSDDILKNLLETAYHSSFMTEESRRVRFSLIFSPKDDPIINSNYGIIKFNKNRDFSIGEIIRLAPATDPSNVLIGVESDLNNQIVIWGLLNIGSSWRNFIRGESGSAFLPPGFLTITSSEPGNLTISCAGINLIDLRQGRYFKPTSNIFNYGPVADFFNEAKEVICNEILEELDNEFYSQTESIKLEFKKAPQNFLERVLFHIREKYHGGMLIVVPDDFTENDQRLTERLLIKYPCFLDKIWKDLITKQVLNYKLFELMFSEEIGEKEIPSEILHEYMFLNDRIKKMDHELTDYFNFISSLSEIDGAVVITNKLKLLGFGAEVIVKNDTPDLIRVAKEREEDFEKYIPIDSYGTRHRSAFRFCYSFENSVAFVISKDGSLRCVKKAGNELILWQDLGLFSDLAIK
jgi:hypothetical protein